MFCQHAVSSFPVQEDRLARLNQLRDLAADSLFLGQSLIQTVIEGRQRFTDSRSSAACSSNLGQFGQDTPDPAGLCFR